MKLATWERTLQVEAKNTAEAKQQALEQFKAMSCDISAADVQDHIKIRR